MLWCQNLRAFRLDLAVANPHLVHVVHQLRDQIEIETGAAERRDLTLRRKDHARIFKRVIKIVAGHDGCRLSCPLLFSKDTGEQYAMRKDSVVCDKQAAATYFFACGCSLPVCCCD